MPIKRLQYKQLIKARWEVKGRLSSPTGHTGWLLGQPAGWWSERVGTRETSRVRTGDPPGADLQGRAVPVLLMSVRLCQTPGELSLPLGREQPSLVNVHQLRPRGLHYPPCLLGQTLGHGFLAGLPSPPIWVPVTRFPQQRVLQWPRVTVSVESTFQGLESITEAHTCQMLPRPIL